MLTRADVAAQSPTAPAPIPGPRAPLPRPVVLKLREELLARAQLTAGEFHAAVRFADVQRVPLPDALVALSYVEERTAYEALSRAVGIPLIDLDETPISPLAVRLVPERVARRHYALPIAEDNCTLRYATAHPFATDVDKDISFASGRHAEPLLACPSQLAAAIDRLYPRLSDVERLLAMRLVESGVTSLEEANRVLAQDERAEPRPSGRKRVLIVDDDRIIRMLVRMILQRDGYDVLEAQNGREGIDMTLQHRPDLLITDLMMPEVDGYETLTALRAEGSCALIPVIVLTAESGPYVERTVLSLDADDYLMKPFDADVLLKRVQSVFVRHLRLAS